MEPDKLFTVFKANISRNRKDIKNCKTFLSNFF